MIRFTQSKKDSRLKRAIKTRKKIKETAGHRISVFRSGRHIYAQLSTSGGDKVITIISTNQKTLRKKVKSNNIENSKNNWKKNGRIYKKTKNNQSCI